MTSLLTLTARKYKWKYSGMLAFIIQRVTGLGLLFYLFLHVHTIHDLRNPETFDDALKSVRSYNGIQGLSLLDDRPIALDSGRVGWLLKTGSRGGTTTMSVYDTRRGYFFAMDVDVSGVTAAELDVVTHVLLSFCVDP